MRQLRAQSAMEYLMTYGWAILIIAVVMVALFSLTGSLQQSGPQACLAASGYLCSNPIYSHVGNINVNIGQNTGATWTAWALAFSPQGTALSTNQVPNVYFSNVVDQGGGPGSNGGDGQLVSGQTVPVNSLEATGTQTAAPVPVGQQVTGTLWVCYTTTAGAFNLISYTGSCDKPATFTGSIYYAQLASFSARAA